MVEHADRHPMLLVTLDVTHEARERRVDGEGDPGFACEFSEPFGPGIVHPEAALEVDLAGPVATLEQQLDGRLRALPRRHACRADPNRSHLRDSRRCRPDVPLWWAHATQTFTDR